MNGAKKTRVLVAEDDEDIRETLTLALANHGWETVEARDGVEALEKATSEPFDVLLLDHRMPRLLGGEVCRKLREAGVSVPVLLVTAAFGVRDLADKFGVRDYLGKPYSLEELLVTLDRLATRPS